MINDIHDLSMEIFRDRKEEYDYESIEARIAKALFSTTKCGICFRLFDRNDALACAIDSLTDFVDLRDDYEPTLAIGVTGYAEGADACCEEIVLEFGKFTADEFWAAVQQADDEGCDLFYEWNNWGDDEDCDLF